MSGPWILTRSGIRFHLAPKARDLYADINIEDISYALSNIQRFTGHGSRSYSVATHSVCVSRLVRNRAERLGYEKKTAGIAALLHDATEAYLGDVSSPLKSMLHEYRVIEDDLEIDILLRFGIYHTQHGSVREQIKLMDMAMLRYEAELMLPNTADASLAFGGLPRLTKQEKRVVDSVLAKVRLGTSGTGRESATIVNGIFLAEFERNGGVP